MRQSTSPDFHGHLRPAQMGDLCVLLEPASSEELQLWECQHTLQARFGGNPIERLHLTCQRFACQDADQVQHYVTDLAEIVAQTQPFSLQAIGLETLYLPVRQTNILKWQITVTPALRHFVAAISQVLVAQGLKSHYLPDFTPSLVAALKDVPPVDPVALTQVAGFPYPLFAAGQVVLSRIQGPNDFAIEGVVTW